MALHPLEPRSTAVLLSLFNFFQYFFDQVLILYRSSDAGDPVILDPVDMPDSNAINGVLGISIN